MVYTVLYKHIFYIFALLHQSNKRTESVSFSGVVNLYNSCKDGHCDACIGCIVGDCFQDSCVSNSLFPLQAVQSPLQK